MSDRLLRKSESRSSHPQIRKKRAGAIQAAHKKKPRIRGTGICVAWGESDRATIRRKTSEGSMKRGLYNYAAVVLCAILGVSGYIVVPWSEMTKADWVSWVQAVGSILAIAGGFAGVIYQTRTAERQRALEVRQREKELFTLITVTANEAILEVEQLSELLSPETFESVAYDDLCRNRMTAQIRRTVSNLEGIDATLSDLLRPSNLQLEHIRLLLKLRRQIGKAVVHLVGVDDPYSQLSAPEVDFAPFAYEMKLIRFFAGSHSVHVDLA